mmetsp:Transcript_681/g.794  ORF Transcript_681/g.794 Transcript_681/m.794 type:complete len:98 (+) Transcript_681:283-576(+)
MTRRRRLMQRQGRALAAGDAGVAVDVDGAADVVGGVGGAATEERTTNDLRNGRDMDRRACDARTWELLCPPAASCFAASDSTARLSCGQFWTPSTIV